MAFAQVDIKPGGYNTANRGFISAEKGRLQGVTIFPAEPGTGANECFAQIYLVSTETPKPILITLLASGYIGVEFGIGWTGSIKLERTYAVLGIVTTLNTTSHWRLTALTDI